jgi:hypothetical protein
MLVQREGGEGTGEGTVGLTKEDRKGDRQTDRMKEIEKGSRQTVVGEQSLGMI